MEKIKIQGKQYPFKLGNAALAKSKREAGVGDEVPEGGDLVLTYCMIYHGIDTGCRIGGVKNPFNCWEELADLLDEDDTAIDFEAVADLINKSLPAPDEKKARGKGGKS